MEALKGLARRNNATLFMTLLAAFKTLLYRYTGQSDIRVGTTMDQVLAAHIGGQTPVQSLTLGIEPNELRLEDGLSMIYGSSLSWISPTKPATKEIYPSRAFDRLVGDGTGRRLDRSRSRARRRRDLGQRP